MATFDLRAIRTALASTVQAALPELNCYPARLGGLVDPPAFVVVGPEIAYDMSFGQSAHIEAMVCRVLGPAGDDLDGESLVDDYLGLGARSIKRALEGTPGVAQTLGGLISDLHVARAGSYDRYQYGENEYPGAELVVEILGLPS